MTVKERILAGFKELSFTVGFHRATVDELSARTGISKRTIYRYFRSKDEMVSAVIDDLMALIEEKVNQTLDSSQNPVEKIISLIRVLSQNLSVLSPTVMGDMQKHYPHIWDRIERFRAQKARKVVEMLIAGNQEGYFREIVPEVFITALQATARDVINPGFILQHNLTIKKTITSVFDIFLYGILSDEARKSGLKPPPVSSGSS